MSDEERDGLWSLIEEQRLAAMGILTASHADLPMAEFKEAASRYEVARAALRSALGFEDTVDFSDG